MNLTGIATRPVLAAAWLAVQRRASVTGILSVSPAAKAGELLETETVEAAIARADERIAFWREEGISGGWVFWETVQEELLAVREHEAAAEGAA